MKEYEIHYLSTEFPGMGAGLGLCTTPAEAVAYFLQSHQTECKAIVEVLFYKNR